MFLHFTSSVFFNCLVLFMIMTDQPGTSFSNFYEFDFEENVSDTEFDTIDDSDNDPDFVEESDHETDSEESEGEEEPDVHDVAAVINDNFFLGKNGFKWSKLHPPANVRTRKHNIILQLPGLRQTARALGGNPEPVDIWHLLFSADIIEEIICWTNVKITNVRRNYSNISNASFSHDLDIVEFKAFIGLLIFTQIFKSSGESVESMFSTDGTGRDQFRATMSMKRFLFILSCLRFDNSNDRENRKKSDPAAAVSSIFKKFIENCQKCMSLGPSVTVDEMLVPFRGKCRFRVYMPKKPAKYGIKVMCMTDAKTGYLFNAYIYTGRGSDGVTLSEEEKQLNIPSQSVISLTKPIAYSNRNVTADNWFSSLELVTELRAKGLTYVGTLKKNKKEIPLEFLPSRKRAVNSSLYGFSNNMTLLSHVPKKYKAVLLISSMHHSASDDPQNGKPEIISYYNDTKGGVDSLDHKCAIYTSSRRNRRWPMAIFYSLLDINAVNSFILYESYKDTPKKTRLEFLKIVAKSLTRPLMERRLMNKNLPRELTLTIRRILRLKEEIQEERREVFEKRKTCYLCPPRLQRKTKYPCYSCQNPICLECANKICKQCKNKM